MVGLNGVEVVPHLLLVAGWDALLRERVFGGTAGARVGLVIRRPGIARIGRAAVGSDELLPFALLARDEGVELLPRRGRAHGRDLSSDPVPRPAEAGTFTRSRRATGLRSALAAALFRRPVGVE